MDNPGKMIYYRIGEYARKMGVTPDFLKYYERLGILHAQTLENGYRYYPFNQSSKILECMRLKNYGFSVRSIEAMFSDDLTAVQQKMDEQIQELEEKAAQICISHAFMIQDIATSIGVFDMPVEDKAFIESFVKNAVYDDYDLLVQLCDALALPSGFCLLEKRFVDVTIRYGIHPATVDRWKAVLAIKTRFEKRMGCSIYEVLPGVIENSFR